MDLPSLFHDSFSVSEKLSGSMPHSLSVDTSIAEFSSPLFGCHLLAHLKRLLMFCLHQNALLRVCLGMLLYGWLSSSVFFSMTSCLYQFFRFGDFHRMICHSSDSWMSSSCLELSVLCFCFDKLREHRADDLPEDREQEISDSKLSDWYDSDRGRISESTRQTDWHKTENENKRLRTHNCQNGRPTQKRIVDSSNTTALFKATFLYGERQ